MKKKEQPLVSIIIPTYGRSKTLIRALKSVQNQTYKNMEIIVVDDNGANTENQINTSQIVNKYLEADNRIRYLYHETNLNGSAARNTGIDNSNGEYICFLDDDDEFEIDKISSQYNKLNELGNDWLGCYTGHTRYFVEDDNSTKIYRPRKEGNILQDVLTFKIDHVSGSSLMIKRKVINSDTRWNESLIRHQDYEFMAKIASQGKIAVISEPKVNIYVHKGSNRQKEFKDIEKTRFEYLRHVKPLIEKLNQDEINEVYFQNYYWLFKQSLKHNKILKVFNYIFKSKNYSRLFKMIILDIKHYLK